MAAAMPHANEPASAALSAGSRRARTPAPKPRSIEPTDASAHADIPVKLRPANGADISDLRAPASSTSPTAANGSASGTSVKPRPTEVDGASTDVFEFGGSWGVFGACRRRRPRARTRNARADAST